MQQYISFVTNYPLFSAMLQFAILGTLGDIISKCIIQGRIHLPFSSKTLFLKMLSWALLAITIKYAFVGFQGFVDSLVDSQLLPELSPFTRALSISVLMNLQFGVFLVIFHRLLDNIIAQQKNWTGLDKGIYSLIWFWIPAHTITFMLDKPYQIGLAAVWSLMLGLILGYYNRDKIVVS